MKGEERFCGELGGLNPWFVLPWWVNVPEIGSCEGVCYENVVTRVRTMCWAGVDCIKSLKLTNCFFVLFTEQ